MSKKAPIYIFYIILAVVILTAVGIVACSYNKNKIVVPDNNISYELTKKNMESIKGQYNTDAKAEEFLKFCEELELKVTNKLLDGTVTTNEELEEEINKINLMFKTTDWSYIDFKYEGYWMGSWQLDENGMLTFEFKYEEIKPNWVNNENIKIYIK